MSRDRSRTTAVTFQAVQQNKTCSTLLAKERCHSDASQRPNVKETKTQLSGASGRAYQKGLKTHKLGQKICKHIIADCLSLDRILTQHKSIYVEILILCNWFYDYNFIIIYYYIISS